MKNIFIIILIILPLLLFSQHSFDDFDFISDSLPEVFDLRKTGILSPVKTQPNGGCWASASNNVLESVLRNAGVGDYLFSDINMQLFSGFNIERKAYGNHLMSTAYYTRGSGPVLKSPENDSLSFINSSTEPNFFINQPLDFRQQQKVNK